MDSIKQMQGIDARVYKGKTIDQYIRSGRTFRQRQFATRQLQTPLHTIFNHKPLAIRQIQLASSSSEHIQPSQIVGAQKQSVPASTIPNRVANAVEALYKFSRPHTMLGTFLGVVSISLLALQPHPLSLAILAPLLPSISAALLANISIVGFNQLCDMPIDAVNKPYLPLVTGQLTPRAARMIVAVCAVAALAISVASTAPLAASVAGSLALGYAYSANVPLLRWKRRPELAAMCILVVRAVVVQLGFFHHMLTAAPLPAPATAAPLVPPNLLFVLSFMCLFSIVIALFKDLPDTRGDKQYAIYTFPVVFGVRAVYTTCIGVLLTAYTAAIGYGVGMGGWVWARAWWVLGHVVLGGALLARARKVDLSRKDDIVSMYMFVWKLFYMEYLMVPFIQ